MRRRHRQMIYGLVAVLPAALVFAVGARRTIPDPKSVHDDAIVSNRFGRVVNRRPDLWPNARITTHVYADANGSLALEFSAKQPLAADLFVYWVAGEAAPHSRLPAQAYLLGSFLDGMILPFPDSQRRRRGRLVLYSLANHETLSVSKRVTIAGN
ncbi:MAG: hypothetical protein U1G07_26555 [Verrucomicrobiota bacterium]